MRSIQTRSVMIQNLCVPCRCRCRHCLLSWDGRTVGTEWERGVSLAERYIGELREGLPGVSVSFAFGYSMEHPEMREAIRTLRRLGSPMAEFLQCDGMAMRDARQCGEWARMLKEEGVRSLNFTFYGLSDAHDRFAGRRGDFALLFRMMNAAREAGIPFDAGIPITGENIRDADELASLLRDAGSRAVRLFIPHGEGRGRLLEPIRLKLEELSVLSPSSLRLLNRDIYRTEAEWLSGPDPVQDTGRLILISLTADTIDSYEGKDALTAVKETEALDEAYYAAFPSFQELAGEYGDAEGTRLYRIRDLYRHYRVRYAADHSIRIYDVTDERQSGSRRYAVSGGLPV